MFEAPERGGVPLPEGNHPAWELFVMFIETTGVVRSDLILGNRTHWEVIWNTFLAGYEAGLETATCQA